MNKCHGCGPIAKFFYRRMPSGVKRMVFVISLVKALAADRFERLDAPLIWRMNKVLQLTQSKTPEALMLIDRITTLEWSLPDNEGQVIDGLLQSTGDVSLSKVVDDVVMASPEWLRYAPVDAIKHDLTTLFSDSDFLLAFLLKMAVNKAVAH